MTHSLVLVRHGQSAWNVSRRFTGWVDVPLTAEGERQALEAGELLAAEGFLPDVVFTSLLLRSVRTADLVVEGCGRDWVPVHRTWRLNERHYGALQGHDKAEFRDQARHPELAELWANPYATRPPPIERGSAFDTSADPRYDALAPDGAPTGESLLDVAERVLVAWSDVIRPALLDSRCVLVVTHANVIRSIIGRASGMTDEDVAVMKVPSGQPLVFDLSPAPDGRRASPDRRLVGPRSLKGAGRHAASKAAELL